MSSRWRWPVGLLVAACLLSAASQAGAQSRQSEIPAQRIPGWAFTPGFTLGMVFDSNVALADAPADTQKTASDRLWLLQPFGDLQYTSPRTDFSGGYRGYIRRYTDLDQLNGFDQSAHVSLRRMVTKRVQLFATDSYARVPTTDEIPLNGVPFTRTGSKTNSFSGGGLVRVTKFTDVSARYDMTWVSFDRTESVLTGGWVHALQGGVSHRLNERTTVGGEYSARFADLNEGTRQVRFQDAGGVVTYALARGTKISASGGLSHLSDQQLNETRTGPYFRASLTHDLEPTVVGVSFERSFVPSFGFGGSTQNQEFGGFVRSPIGRTRMYVQGSASWRRSEPFVLEELRLDTIWLRSTVGYAVQRWLRTEAFYTYTRQDSRITGGEINRHRVGVQAVFAQPVRLR